MSKPYRDYLRSPRWTATRHEFLKRIGWTCEKCHIYKVSTVHHLNYDSLGHETPQDLLGLCHRCHERLHRPLPKLQAANDNQLPLPLGDVKRA